MKEEIHMKTSDQIDKLAEALAKAQGSMKNPEKNKTATIPTKAGGKYSYNYADLPSTIDCVRRVLSENGLSHVTVVSASESGGPLLLARLLHNSGQWIESEYPLPKHVDVDDKAFASSITYGRRYLLTALLGLAGDDDLDATPEHPEAEYELRKVEKPVAQSLPKPVVFGSLGEVEKTHVIVLAKNKGWTNDQVGDFIKTIWGKEKLVDLTKPQYQELTASISTLSYAKALESYNVDPMFQEDQGQIFGAPA